uniref:Fe2OG dioxygenase domain-containing protein n=1 Tax=Clytia hemisphaerica TaxID=252671 RepID=A0A7M5WWJ7_9CNID
MVEENFPIIDISSLVQTQCQDETILQEAANQLMDGFSKWGFIYLKGHPIPEESIATLFKESENFFTQPVDKKREVEMDATDSDYIMGYVPFKMERIDPRKPFDLKEAFDYKHHIRQDMKQKLPPQFTKSLENFFDECYDLSLLLFKLLNKSLDIEDDQFFPNCHRKSGYFGNGTLLRSLYYPGIDSKDILPEQSRCGVHADYGTLTLLFQNAEGLEVKSPSGNFIKAKLIEGTIIVNAADLLERWSSGRIKSTLHRVSLPKDTNQPRQSIAFFVNPDNETLVECLDGSNTCKPIRASDWLTKRFGETLS